jgi:D-alanyl-D-alanine dipeptidase
MTLPVDGYLANRIVGSRALCAALERAREKASSLGFGLLLWDGYRPQRAVDCFLRWSREPEDGRTKRRHYPNIESYECEWWHYTLKHEPYPDTYFDFPIM